MNKFKLTKEWVLGRLPKRPKDANKGTFGKVLVVAGSSNFPGAAYLACVASYRVGAGLVTLATEPEVKIIVSRKLPEVTFLPFGELFEKLSGYDVLLIGPGLGQSEQAAELIERYRGRIVIDGDGLNALSKMDKWWEKLQGKLILTPHPGEMVRLTGLTVGEIQKDRINITNNYSKKWGQTVVLKGANTVIADPSGQVLVSPFANPILATAGTGDVLAGVIAGLLAQGLKDFEAACAGVYLHGLAGEKLQKKFGDTGGLASDLLPLLPEVIKNLK